MDVSVFTRLDERGHFRKFALLAAVFFGADNDCPDVTNLKLDKFLKIVVEYIVKEVLALPVE